LIVSCSAFIAFHAGVWAGMHVASCDLPKEGVNAPPPPPPPPQSSSNNNNIISEEELQRKVEALANKKIESNLDELCKDNIMASTSSHETKSITGGGSSQNQ